jgi:NAD+ kinase
MKFSMDDYKEEIMKVIQGPFILTLRSRIRVTHRSGLLLQEPSEENESMDQRNVWGEDYNAYTCVNEAVMDRGPSSFLSSIDCHLDGKHITTVQGDGFVIIVFFTKINFINLYYFYKYLLYIIRED